MRHASRFGGSRGQNLAESSRLALGISAHGEVHFHMLFADPPEIISPSAGNPDFDDMIFHASNEHGIHRVSVLVPGGKHRTRAVEARALDLAEAALAKALAQGTASINVSSGW